MKKTQTSQVETVEASSVPLEASRMGYEQRTYDAPFETDAATAAAIINARLQLDSITLFKKDLSAAMLIDPANLDYDAAARLTFNSYKQVQSGFYLATQQWSKLATLMTDLLPKNGGGAKYRRGYQFVTLEALHQIADEMVQAAAATKAGQALTAEGTWVPAVRTLLNLIIEAMFAPLHIVDEAAMKPHVEFATPTSRLPGYADLRAIAALNAVKEALILAAPSEAFSEKKVPVFGPMAFTVAIREYFIKLGVAVAEAGYRSDLLIRTALRLVQARACYVAGVNETFTGLSLPAAYFQSTKLTSLLSNYTVMRAAAEYDIEGARDEVASAADAEAAIDHLIATLHNAFYLETLPLNSVAQGLSLTEITDSTRRRAGILLSYHDGVERPAARAYTILQQTKQRFVRLEDSHFVQPAIAELQNALPVLSKWESEAAIIRALARDSDEWQRRTARVVVAQRLMSDNKCDWRLEAAAMARCSCYSAYYNQRWHFIYCTTPDPGRFAQRMVTANGGVLTTDPLLAIYLTWPEQMQAQTLEFDPVDLSQISKGWTRFADLRTQALMKDADYLAGPMPSLTNIGSQKLTIQFGTYRSFMNIDLVALTAFLDDARYAREMSDLAQRTIEAVSLIKGLSAQGVPAKVLEVDCIQALLPAYRWLLSAASAAAFAKRTSAAMRGLLSRISDGELKVRANADLASAAIRAEVDVAVVLMYLVGAEFLSQTHADALRALFSEFNLHELIGAYAINQAPQMVPLM